MNRQIIVALFLLCLASGEVKAQNAPISIIGNVTATGTTATVGITAVNFSNMAASNLEILYNSSIVTVTGVTTSPQLGGGLTVDLSSPGIIYMSWYTFPGKTLADNSVIFNIACSKIVAGTSTFVWFDNGISCHWYNGNYVLLNDSPTSTYYVNGSVTFPGALIADFSANNTLPQKNTPVQFSDLTSGVPSSWNWSFDRSSVIYVNGTSSTSQNPQVQFTECGPYTVTLVASNSGNSDTKVKTSYICAGSNGLWGGTSSSSWSIAANWDNGLVPGSSTDIVIPATCTNWPVFDGDLIIGVNCKSLTLSSPDSHLTINGNLILH